MTLTLNRLSFLATATLACSLASSAIIYDFSPDALNANVLQTGDSGPAANIATGSNWVEDPLLFGTFLPQPKKITGMDIYTSMDRVSIGDEVLITFIQLIGTGIQVTTFNSIISAIDFTGISENPSNIVTLPGKAFVRAFADFGSNDITIDGDPFLIGMTGLQKDIGILTMDPATGTFHPGRDGLTPGFIGSDITFPPAQILEGDMAFRLHSSVPDNASTLLLFSLGLLAMLGCKKAVRD